MEQLVSSLLKFWYTIFIVIVFARLLYYRHHEKKEILFTYILLSAIISMLCILISRVEISLGFALGIFAIFGIIRYRTTQVSPREMTYLFLCSGTAAKNMLAPENIEFFRLIVSDISVILLATIAEYFIFRGSTYSKNIVYNNLDLIHPDKRKELEEDLSQRFGINDIQKIRVGEINTSKKSARIMVNFKDDEGLNIEE